MDQMDYQLLELILGASLVGLFLLGLFLLIGIKMLRGGSKRKREKLDEENRLIQEIYQGLIRMEQRVESLETILFDTTEGRGRSSHERSPGA